MRRRRTFVGLSTVALVAATLVGVGANSAHAATVPVTVNITKLIQRDNPDPGVGNGQGDFKAQVEIDGTVFPFSSIKEDSPNNEPTDWVWSKNIDDTNGIIHIGISIFDDDSGVLAPDDEIDINPTDNKLGLAINYDPITGDWTFDGNDLPFDARTSTGDDDTAHAGVFEGGEPATIDFEISKDSTNGDADGDGLLDGWERLGLDDNDDGVVDVNLPAMGANPLHQDLYLENDYEAGQTQTRSGVLAMKAAFAAAPRGNPDGINGITAHVDTGALVDPTATEGQPLNTCNDGIDNGGDGTIDAADSDCVNPGGSGRYLDGSVEDPQPGNCGDGVNNDGANGTDAADPSCLVGDNLGGGTQIPTVGNCGIDAAFYSAKAANFNSLRRWVFRYSISSAQPGTCTPSGGQGEIGGNDFTEFNHDGGTLMHELGHTLNLHHGGNVDNNCKPNYVSGMNYDNQSGINRVGGGKILDYSPPRLALNGSTRGAVPGINLVENALNDGTVLDSTDANNRYVFVDTGGNKVQYNLNQGSNWNSDSPEGTPENGQTVNIDTIGKNGRPKACNNAVTNSTLTPFNDWNTVSLPFRQFGDSASGAINPETDLEPTTQDMQALDTEINTTDLSVAVTDSPEPVTAGTQLTYFAVVKNKGVNPAGAVKLVDTLPSDAQFASATAPCTHASGVVTCFLGDMQAGTSKTITITTNVPANVVYVNRGQKTITNTAKVENLNGTDSNTLNNEDITQTDVVGVSDVRVDSFTATTPPLLVLGQATSIPLSTTVSSTGPSSPFDTKVNFTSTAPAGVTVSPSASATFPDLIVGTPVTFPSNPSVTCTTPGIKTITFKQEIFPDPGISGLSDSNNTNNAKSLTFNLDCVVPVVLNIRPGNNLNRIVPPESKGVPMAVLTTTAGQYGLPVAFDATKILPNTVKWGKEALVVTGGGQTEKDGKGSIQNSVEKAPISPNENLRDKDLDMVLDFTAKNSGLVKGDTKACVLGTYLGAGNVQFRFFGCDIVFVESVPGKK